MVLSQYIFVKFVPHDCREWDDKLQEGCENPVGCPIDPEPDLKSISAKFYDQHLCQFPFNKKFQIQTVIFQNTCL
jgi:hypothetical protein